MWLVEDRIGPQAPFALLQLSPFLPEAPAQLAPAHPAPVQFSSLRARAFLPLEMGLKNFPRSPLTPNPKPAVSPVAISPVPLGGIPRGGGRSGAIPEGQMGQQVLGDRKASWCVTAPEEGAERSSEREVTGQRAS